MVTSAHTQTPSSEHFSQIIPEEQMDLVLTSAATVSVVTLSTSASVMSSLIQNLSYVVGAVRSSVFRDYAPSMTLLIDQLDVDFHLKVIGAYLKNRESAQSECELAAVDGVRQSLSKMLEVYKALHVALQSHHEKYFSSWRSFQCPITEHHVTSVLNRLMSRFQTLSMVQQMQRTAK